MATKIKTRIVKRTELCSTADKPFELSYYYIERECGFLWKWWQFVKLFSSLEAAKLYRDAYMARNGVQEIEEVINVEER